VSSRLLLNLACQIISAGVAFDDEAREAFHEAMDWPEQVEEHQETEQDRSARKAAFMLGSDDVDAMVMRAWEARQRGQAAAEEAPE
jgi:uncharacterized membrane protein